MAVNIFEKYGIKEVANVYFEALADDVKNNVYEGDIVLYLDTLKVSTIEQSAEQADARGGWGNPKLVSWDYGKEITLTLTDALISLESLRFMMGGSIKNSATDTVYVQHTEEVIVGANGIIPKPKHHLTGKEMTPKALLNHPIRLINLTQGVRNQIVYDSATPNGNYTIDGTRSITFKVNGTAIAEQPVQGDRMRIFWYEEAGASSDTKSAVEVTISPETFPGTYKIVGDTFMRSEETGKDEAFQFIIQKAKVASNVTITLEAEGDPSTFEMTVNVLRGTNDEGQNEMMKLVRYGFDDDSAVSGNNDRGSISGS